MFDTAKSRRRQRATVAEIQVVGDGFVDCGVGIVITRRPLTLLAPTHVVALLESDVPAEIRINGTPLNLPEVLPAAGLNTDHLVLLRFAARKPSLCPIDLPRCPRAVSDGSSAWASIPKEGRQQRRDGRIVRVERNEDGTSILTDIRIKQGESGSPLFVNEMLVGIVQGYRGGSNVDGGEAVALPLTSRHLGELMHERRALRVRRLLKMAVVASACAAMLVFAVLGLLSRFSFGAVSLSKDAKSITVKNASSLSLRGSWSRTLDNSVRRYATLPSSVGGAVDRVVLGTLYEDVRDGRVVMLDRLGRELWEYSVPDGECIYASPEESYDGYLVDLLHIADLDGDGRNEVVAVFVHNHYSPCKLVILDLEGTVIAEYWHPGYIRTVASGKLGPAQETYLVLSASNNRLSETSDHPQTLFCFSAADVSGQAPPYTGGDYPAGSELWYYVIPWFSPDTFSTEQANLETSMRRPKCYEIDFTDVDGDGNQEVQAATTDGRFYELDEFGQILGIDAADRYVQAFGERPVPELVPVQLDLH